jgi:predicted ArsR family transcriptional regulator
MGIIPKRKEKKMKVTVKEFAARMGLHGVEANGALKVLARAGLATATKIESGKRGKPAMSYEIDGRMFRPQSA